MARRRSARRTGRRTARRTTNRVARRRRRRRRRIMVGGMVLLGGGAIAYKLTRPDADKIEAATGQSVEELSDEELQQAMKQLGIQSQPLSTEDQAALGKVPPVGPDEDMDDPVPTAASAPPAAAPTPDYIDQLKQLAALRDAGILTPEEFEAKKAQILGL